MLTRLDFKELKHLSRLYANLPRAFLESIYEGLSKYLNILWPNSEDIPSNQEKRQTLEKKFVSYDRFPMSKLYPNVPPFNSALRAITRFDLFCGNCLKANINPYKSHLFQEQFPDWSPKQFARWVSGIFPIPLHHAEKMNQFFRERLGQEFNKFWPYDIRINDNTLLHLGYLTYPPQDEWCQEDYWSGDRSFPGADKRLVLTIQAQALPLFRYLGHRDWEWTGSEFQLKRTRIGFIKFDEADYLKKCGGFARRRFDYWKTHQKLVKILRSMDERREQRKQYAERLTATLVK